MNDDKNPQTEMSAARIVCLCLVIFSRVAGQRQASDALVVLLFVFEAESQFRKYRITGNKRNLTYARIWGALSVLMVSGYVFFSLTG